MTDEEILDRWRTEVYENHEEVDPEQLRDWFDMSYGFFLALTDGDTVRAMELALRNKHL